MKISAQEEYGMRCLMRLARQCSESPLTIPEIAAAENLSTAHVAKLLTVLRQAGLVESARGRTGGYRLSRPASQIRLGSVMLALGEPLFEEPAYCERHSGLETTGPCVHQGGCNLKGLWQTLEQWLRHVLDQITLEDLLTGQMPVVQQLREQLPASSPPLLTLTSLSRS